MKWQETETVRTVSTVSFTKEENWVKTRRKD